jgi:hypothetical protein
MNGDILVRCLEVLCGISLLIQVAEYLRIAQSSDAKGIWSWPIQRVDIPPQTVWVGRFLDLVFQPTPYRVQLWVRGLAAVVLIVQGASLGLALVLFVGTLLLLVRWRGAFNGGSDFMSLVTITGILIAQVVALWADKGLGWAVGLSYIAIHTLSSYFVSGWIKLLQPEWRSGRALTVFLNGGIYGPLPPDSVFRRPRVAMFCSWAFILWEAVFPLGLFNQNGALLFMVIAVVFHFLVFWFFGLNRFFWAWLTNLTAVWFVSGWASQILG